MSYEIVDQKRPGAESAYSKMYRDAEELQPQRELHYTPEPGEDIQELVRRFRNKFQQSKKEGHGSFSVRIDGDRIKIKRKLPPTPTQPEDGTQEEKPR